MKNVLLLSALGAAGLFGCTKEQVADPFCDIAVQGLTGAAKGIADTLHCENLPAVAATLTKPVKELKLCEGSTTQGLVGDLVCPQAAKFVVGLGLGNLPSEWKCSGGDLGATAEQIVVDN